MLAGELYHATDPELTAGRLRARRLCREYNASTEEEPERRAQLLRELLGSMTAETYIEPPFRCDYGSHLHVGRNFYANFELIVLDVCEVRIGENCFIGPRVSLMAATHPVEAELRNTGAESGRPITIGNNVWIGGGAIINPGVTLGDNTVVASGAVVTRSFDGNVVIGGVPARILRTIEG
jgi:maltose O-acetyltransferase